MNNFLTSMNGKRCTIFIYEFEKTTKEIHQSLLLPFDNGKLWIEGQFIQLMFLGRRVP